MEIKLKLSTGKELELTLEELRELLGINNIIKEQTITPFAYPYYPPPNYPTVTFFTGKI